MHTLNWVISGLRVRRQVMLRLALGMAGITFGCGIDRTCPEDTAVPASARSTKGIKTSKDAYFDRVAIPTDAVRYPYNHAATIVELEGGDLLVAWGAGSRELGPDTQIVASRRSASTKTWSAPAVIADKPDRADANPVLFTETSGAVHLFHVEMFGETFCLGRVVERISRDGAATWGEPRIALEAVCTMVKNKPLRTSTGRWVLPAYQEAIYQSQFWTSDDGVKWTASSPLLTLLNNNLQPSVVECSDGTLLALMRCAGNGRFTWEGRSSDGGKSWSLKDRCDLPNPNSGLDMVRLADGKIVLIYNPSKTDRTPISAAISTDDGKTWSVARTIESGDPQLSYPAVIQTRDGMIHAVYSHRLEHIEHVEFNVEWLAAGA
jgi:predicted neuraminidase